MRVLKKIPCCLVRGGTSKGLMFLDEHLPKNNEERTRIILKILDAEDQYGNQINGLGSGKSVTNKVAVLKKSSREDIDLDFFFYQAQPKSNILDILPNCGNFISAAPIFAFINELIEVNSQDCFTNVKIFNTNTEQIIHAIIKNDKKSIIVDGDEKLDGVSGSFAPIELKFFNINGDKNCGNIFPTGNKIDIIDNIKTTIINISVPMIIIDGDDIGVDAKTKIALLKSEFFIKKIHDIRNKALRLMFLDQKYEKFSIPKISIVCKSTNNCDIKSYYYDPFALHDNYAVTGGFCLAASCLIDGTTTNKFYNKEIEKNNEISIAHQNGKMNVIIDYDAKIEKINYASIIRTSSILMKGDAYYID